MRTKHFATVDIEFEMEDPGYDRSAPELRDLLHDAIRHGLTGQQTHAPMAAAVNLVKVTNWNP